MRLFIMKKFAVTGNPAAHSKSPDIFNILCSRSGVKADYTRISITKAEEISYFAAKYGISGFNVTSPFKEEMFKYADNSDQVSKEVKAVNLVLCKAGLFCGFNTDVYGIQRTLFNNHIEVENKKCVVAGSGGAARSAVFALKELGAEVFISNRTDLKAERISSEYNCGFISFERLSDNLNDTFLYIPAVTEMDESFRVKASELIIFEANYRNPVFSRELCKKYISGYEWLINQAIKSFEIFFDIEVGKGDIGSEILRVRNKRNISLIGPTLSGKTSCGKLLAEKLNLEFYDSDEQIEKVSRRSISAIFKEKGEDYFRILEEKIISEILQKENVILSTGAGAVKSDVTVKLLKEKCFTVLLDTATGTVLSRANVSEISKRPLLQTIDLTAKIDGLFNLRKDNYYSAADLIIQSDESSIEIQAERILKELNAR